VLLLMAAFAVIYFSPRSAPPARTQPGVEQVPATPSGTAVAPATLPTQGNALPTTENAINPAFAAVHTDSAEAVVTTLRNDFIEAHFPDSGGALRNVALIKRDEKGRLIYPDELGSDRPFVLNGLAVDPILAFVDFPGLD